MERIKTYTSFETDTKPEIEELHKAGQVHENELKTEEEIDNEVTAEEVLQASEEGTATEIQMDENAMPEGNKSGFIHIKTFKEF